ncbi:MAG TPA: type IV toxin-antitoxin system AbiEi family antitoxin domain-containing protein [Planctomycetota bacterium]|jgi:predicted transcriptional regulator of viral defense system
MNASESSKAERILNLLRRQGYIRARDLDALSVERIYLSRLCEKGLLKKAGRGIYALADAPVSEWHTLALTAKLVPEGVVCLLSALRFHGIGTQQPHEVWIALDRRAATPKPGYPKVRVVRPSGAALSGGVERHEIEGTPVKIFSAAKTVVDCFKYRNKIGMDVALEALREGQRARKFTRENIWRYAKACRVANVMRPYMEALA